MANTVEFINPLNLRMPAVSETHSNVKQFIELKDKERKLNKELEDVEKKISELGKNIVAYNVNIVGDGCYHLFSARCDADSFVSDLVERGVKKKHIQIEVTNNWSDIEYIDLAINDQKNFGDIEKIYRIYSANQNMHKRARRNSNK